MPVRLWGVDPFVPRGDETWKPLYALCETWGIDYIRNGPVTMTYDGEDLPSSSEERESSKVGMREHTRASRMRAGGCPSPCARGRWTPRRTGSSWPRAVRAACG